MADEEHRWLRQHAHETNTLSYGHIGTATYDQREQRWIFLRRNDHEVIDNTEDVNGTDGVAGRQHLRLLGDVETVVGASRADLDPAISNSQSSVKVLRRVPELMAAASIVYHTGREDHTDKSDVQTGQLFDLGHAVWLGSGSVDSGNLKVPIHALVSGPGANVLRLTTIGRQSLDYKDGDGIMSKLFIPSILSDSIATWTNTEPILQVVFSSLNQDGHGNTFLAVRLASSTSILQPLLPRNASSASESSTIDPNLLLSIDMAMTGGHPHADVAFHPSNQRSIAIVDVQGSWSIWHIKGRRSHTARILYQAHLRSSGKVFSWAHKRRPEHIRLYFDEWHKIIWLSNNGNTINRLLVCNRQSVKVFDLKGNETCSIDARLDTRNTSSYILDIKAGLQINLCFVLTTSKLLLFDLAQKEWRDIGRYKGPALLCAWQHFQNPTNTSLKISTVVQGQQILVALYASTTKVLRLYKLKLTQLNGKQTVVSSDPTTLKLLDLPTSKMKNVLLASIQVTSRRLTADAPLPNLLQIVVIHEDLTVSTVLAEWAIQESSRSANVHGRPFIQQPPGRGTRFKSERRVDGLDDEESLLEFVVPESSIPHSIATPKIVNNQAGQLSKPVLSSKHISTIRDHVSNVKSSISSSGEQRLAQCLHGLTEAIHDIHNASDMSTATTISEFLVKTPRIDDVEQDSAALAQALSASSSSPTEHLLISDIHGTSNETLVRTYQNLFNTYVSSLPSDASDRTRVQRERLAREIALDLHLSGHVIRRGIPSINPPQYSENQLPSQNDSQTMLSSDALIFSDPIKPTHSHPDPRYFSLKAQSSASQPQTSTLPTKHTSTISTIPPPLDKAISRLSALTTISNPPTITKSVETHITNLLSHLPTTADINPNTYDWATAELESTTTTTTSTTDPSTRNKQSRKARNLLKAKKRSETIKPTTSTGIITNQNPASLPLPLAHRPSPHLPTTYPPQPHQNQNSSQYQIHQHSDPNPHSVYPNPSNSNPTQISSSAAGNMAMQAATQPERGVFGARVQDHSTNRGGGAGRRKKRRVAGF